MLAMKRPGGCDYISDGQDGVLACPVEFKRLRGKLRLMPEGKQVFKLAHLLREE